MPQTKEQRALKKKEYYEKNKEYIDAYRKEYRKRNKEQIAIKGKEYREKNKEKLSARGKKYNKENKEKISAYHKEYRKKNPEKLAAKSKAYQQTEAYIKNRRIYIKQYREKNKEKIVAQVSAHYYKNKKHKMAVYRQRLYGITPEDYDTMLKEQNHKCKICSVDFLYDKHNTKPFIDHCHTTNKVRGLLCLNCNAGLGYFKDNTETLTKALNYLQENG